MDNNEGNLLQALEEGSRKNFGSDVDFIDFGDHSSFHASRSGLGFFNCNYAPPTRDPPITKKLIDSLYKKIFQLELIHEERGDDVYEGLQHTPSVMLGILSTALARLPKPEAKRREQSCNSSPPSSRPNHTRRISAPSTPPTPSHSRSLSVRSVHFSISRQPRAISAEVVQAFVSAKSKQPITTLNMQERNSYYMHTQKALYQSRVLPEKIMDVVLSYTNFNMHCLRCGILYNASLLPNNSNMCPIKPHPEYDRDKGRGLRATVSHLPPFQEEKDELLIQNRMALLEKMYVKYLNAEADSLPDFDTPQACSFAGLYTLFRTRKDLGNDEQRKRCQIYQSKLQHWKRRKQQELLTQKSKTFTFYQKQKHPLNYPETRTSHGISKNIGRSHLRIK